MPSVRRAAPEVIANATAQRWEPAEVLRVLLARDAGAGRRSPLHVLVRDGTDSYRLAQATAGEGVMPLAD